MNNKSINELTYYGEKLYQTINEILKEESRHNNLEKCIYEIDLYMQHFNCYYENLINKYLEEKE